MIVTRIESTQQIMISLVAQPTDEEGYGDCQADFPDLRKLWALVILVRYDPQRYPLCDAVGGHRRRCIRWWSTDLSWRVMCKQDEGG